MHESDVRSPLTYLFFLNTSTSSAFSLGIGDLHVNTLGVKMSKKVTKTTSIVIHVMLHNHKHYFKYDGTRIHRMGPNS